MVEGLAHFMQAMVRERQEGRKSAIAYLQQFRSGLAEAEKQGRTPAEKDAAPVTAAATAGAQANQSPAGKVASAAVPAPPPAAAPANPVAPGADAPPLPEGQPLIRATDDVYYRSKALFVWWMLRDMLGDEALQGALHQYRVADDREPSYLQRIVESSAHRQMEWFFDDWIYRDRGLPDFRIEAVNARSLLPEGVTVSVTVVNDGDAGAEVPVIVPTSGGDALQRVLVPAHGKVTTRLNAAAIPNEVRVNDGSVPESDTGNNSFTVKREP